jgi:hypothetical protein
VTLWRLASQKKIITGCKGIRISPLQSGVFGVGRQEEHPYGPRQALERAQARQDELAEIRGAAQNYPAYPVVLDVVPHLLVRVQFRRVRRQKKQPESAFLTAASRFPAQSDFQDGSR